MSTDAASKFLDRLIGDPQLRGRFRSDPEGTMVEAGLDEAQRRSISSERWDELGDQELTRRVSKNGRVHF